MPPIEPIPSQAALRSSTGCTPVQPLLAPGRHEPVGPHHNHTDAAEAAAEAGSVVSQDKAGFSQTQPGSQEQWEAAVSQLHSLAARCSQAHSSQQHASQAAPHQQASQQPEALHSSASQQHHVQSMASQEVHSHQHVSKQQRVRHSSPSQGHQLSQQHASPQQGPWLLQEQRQAQLPASAILAGLPNLLDQTAAASQAAGIGSLQVAGRDAEAKDSIPAPLSAATQHASTSDPVRLPGVINIAANGPVTAAKMRPSTSLSSLGRVEQRHRGMTLQPSARHVSGLNVQQQQAGASRTKKRLRSIEIAEPVQALKSVQAGDGADASCSKKQCVRSVAVLHDQSDSRHATVDTTGDFSGGLQLNLYRHLQKR